MGEPTFDEKGFDRTTFKPFALRDCRATQWKDVRLTFNDWDGIRAIAGGDSIDGYHLNGYGVEGLVKAAMVGVGLDVDDGGIQTNSEGDTCNIHFTDFALAVKAAAAAAE